MTDDLLEAIDALIAPVRTRVLQDGMGAITIVRPSLLEQLGAAVTSSNGNDGASKSGLPSERNVIDSDAQYQHGLMVSQIESWARIRGVVGRLKPADGLRAWYAAHVLVVPREDTFYTHKIWSWVRLIETKLDPPKRLELIEPCPVCGKEKWVDHNGHEYRFPIVIEYWETGTPESKAICRSCEHVWEGQTALRKLRWDIDVRSEG